MATIKFCKNNSVSQGSICRRLSLVERIRKSQQESEDGRKRSRESALISVKRAPHEKSSRIINIGWVLNGMTVREKNGGGTRSVSIDKSARKTDILEKGLNLFFPGGISAKIGELSKYSYELLDFKLHTLNDNYTVGEMYNMTGINLLRFYLSTKILEAEVSSDEGLGRRRKKVPKTTSIPVKKS